jgi:aspartyl-tRNA(Asn)/glutamyl-tRNA(Gln) amidotransferase subunit B
MRCDANVSIRPTGQHEFGERTEIKNINSFRFVERAIELEIERQIDVLESGGSIERETRLFDADADETRTMRSKELSEDYRYFPDPDLLPLEISAAYVQHIRDHLPELPDARRQRYQTDLGLSAYDAASLSNDIDTANYFEAVLKVCGNAKLSANWLNGELSAQLNNTEQSINASPVSPEQLGILITRIDDSTLSSKTAKELFKALWAGADANASVDELIEQLGLKQMSDDGELTAIVNKVLEENPDQVAELRAGKDKVVGFLVGQVMKATGGKANPKQVNELIRSNL